MTDFRMRVAGLDVVVRSMHDRVFRQCADYLEPSEGFERDAAHADVAFATTQSAIDHERGISDEGDWPDAYLETLAVFRAIAEAAPAHGRMVFHGATIGMDGRAYIFTAPSGTGKTTHIALWRRVFGDRMSVINGDKPMLEVTADGVVAYGTPWAGKEGWQRNVSAPLAGVCVVGRAEPTTAAGESAARAAAGLDAVTAARSVALTPDARATGSSTDASASRSSSIAVRKPDDGSVISVTYEDADGVPNSCTRLGAAEALPLVLRQTYMPADPTAAASTLELLDRLLAMVPVCRLSCTVSEAAVRASSALLLDSAPGLGPL